ETVKVWYLRDAQVPTGPQPLVVSGTHTQNVAGLHLYWASYSFVDQANPVAGSAAAYNAATTVTFGSAITFFANGKTFYVSGNGGTAPEAPPATFTQVANYTNSNGHS